MIAIACAACANALHVIGDVEEIETLLGKRSDFHPDKYVCFNCGGPAVCVLVAEISTMAGKALTFHEVTPQEAFAALHGMGLPAEATCCVEVVEAMFKSCGITVHGKQLLKTPRYVVESLTFPDGRTIHLGASSVGALAYRITKKHSYVAAVEKEIHVD